MTLRNLLGISIEAVTPDAATIARLLAAAERNLADAALPALSAENRFDAAYKAIMQCAMVALHAQGYRTLTSRPGHHQTAIQTLRLTLELTPERLIVLDALRKQRHLTDYDGEPVPDSAVLDCIAQARELFSTVNAWLATKHPNLS
ncbi:MAG: DNA-binding protein [Betaproteobacteria bacterium]|nr:DNA-binding protein [Betaproteobacteria bacterium]